MQLAMHANLQENSGFNRIKTYTYPHAHTHFSLETEDSKKKSRQKKNEDNANKNILGRTPFHGNRKRKSPYKHFKKILKKYFM
jgi:hypothetical protein